MRLPIEAGAWELTHCLISAISIGKMTADC